MMVKPKDGVAAIAALTAAVFFKKVLLVAMIFMLKGLLLRAHAHRLV